MKQPKECTSITDVRNEIDGIDQQIVELIGKRFQYVKEIIRFKKNEDDVLAKKRYDEVFQLRRQWAEQQGVNPDVIEEIYKTMVHHFIDEQMKMLKDKKA
jgi:isochorismate pyruvate lyase